MRNHHEGKHPKLEEQEHKHVTHVYHKVSRRVAKIVKVLVHDNCVLLQPEHWPDVRVEFDDLERAESEKSLHEDHGLRGHRDVND